jgi:predicted MPP superfamily phosphohydrolase
MHDMLEVNPLERYKSASIEQRKLREQKKHSTSNLRERFFSWVCGMSLWPRLFKNTCQSLEVNEQSCYITALPDVFVDFRILFITDMHLDIKPNASETLRNMTLHHHDIVILGGDFFDSNHMSDKIILRNFLSNFDQDIYAILGNHDSVDMIEMLENEGVHVLFNTSTILKRGAAQLLLTGVDDVSQFWSHLQGASSKEAAENFTGCKIMVSHSPDFLVDAQEAGYDLQLSGHTHGGQFKLFNQAIFKQTIFSFALEGNWKYNTMHGFTSTGMGSSRFPIRNVTPEISFITLKNQL